MKKIRINLTLIERTALICIARKTKMACWFSLSTDREGHDCVYDLEKRRHITLRYGVKLLREGIEHCSPDELIHLGISTLEQKTFKNICKRLEV